MGSDVNIMAIIMITKQTLAHWPNYYKMHLVQMGNGDIRWDKFVIEEDN